jgi:hypothetical protein
VPKSKQDVNPVPSAFPGASRWKLPATTTADRQLMPSTKESTMNRTILKAVVIAGLLTLAVSAYAANTITLSHPAILNGKQLDAGEYQVKVSGSGDVTFLRGKTEAATAKARVEERDEKASGDTVVYSQTKDGAVITEIQFAGKKQVLVFDNTSQASNDRGGGRQ